MADILITDAMIEAGANAYLKMGAENLTDADIFGGIYLAMNATRTMDNVSDARLAKPALGEEAMIEVREALVHARDTFYRYTKLHQAKCTDEGDEKACANVSMGEEMSRALDAMNAARTMDDAPDARADVPITPEIHVALNRALMASTKTVGVMVSPEQLEAMRGALEWWDRQATSWLGSRVPEARPGWMQPAIDKGRAALAPKERSE